MTRRFKVLIASLTVAVFAAPSAQAMTNFARKYDVSCNVCHTHIPALNETGYKFRAAGFRMPEEIGKAQNKKIELGDTFAARVQGRYDLQVTNQPNGAPGANLLPSGAP